MKGLLAAGRLRRRIVTIPLVLLASFTVWVLSPLLLGLAVAADLLTGPRRLRLTRLVLFGLNYVLLECGAIGAAAALWPVTGFGLFTKRRWAIRLNAGVERWWVVSVMRATQRWMYVDIHVDDLDDLRQGPMVIAAHHVSFFDAVLPAVLLAWARSDAIARYTLKREMLLSPAIDLFGHRLPNHFVDRTPAIRSVELEGFTALARDLHTDALVVFPEGTFHTEVRAERAVARIGRTDPERAERVGRLRHMLPLRPAGLSALLDAAPQADLVLVAHAGFAAFGTIRAVIANTPLRGPVAVRITRVAAADIPSDPSQRTAFLDAQWLAMDEWITSTVVP